MLTAMPKNGHTSTGPFDQTPNAATTAHQLGGRKAGQNDWRLAHLCAGAAPGDPLGDNPGLSIGDGNDGLIVKCHYGCDTAAAYAAVRAALGIDNRRTSSPSITTSLRCPDCNDHLPADRLIPRTGWPALTCRCGTSYDRLLSAVVGDPWTAWAEYRLADGKPRSMVRRFPPLAGKAKTTWEQEPVGPDGKRPRRQATSLTPLVWATDAPNAILLIVEGEKAAAALVSAAVHNLGYTTISTQSSAGMATADYAETVAGRHVIIWPDDDPPHERTGKRAGPEAAIKASARILDAGAISVRMVNPEAVAHLVPAGSKEKGADAADIRPEHLPELLENAADAAERRADVQQQSPPADHAPDTDYVMPRWVDIGHWVARRVLDPDYAYRHEEDKAAWWAWRDSNHWSMLPTDSHEMGDRLHHHQYALAHELRIAGSDEAAALVASKAWQEHVRSSTSPLMAGIRDELTRKMQTPPNHVIAVANGVLNLKESALHPHDPRGPYLITAVTNGAYLPEQIDHMRNVIDLRLSPAIPDAERRNYLYKCLTLMLGGQAGGNDRGSLLYLLGTSGGGKGNTSRVIRDAAGTYALTGNCDAMFAKGDINETLARILELSPRVIFFHEADRMPMGKVMSMTGGDAMSARGPHKSIIERCLFAGVIVTAVAAPQGRMDSGAKRRLASVLFSGKARVSRTTATDATTQEQRDALVTVVLADAITMWQSPAKWEPLPDEDPDAWQAVAAADPVEAAIDTLDDAHIGKSLSEILVELQEDPDTGDPSVKKLTSRAFSSRITQREDWKSCRHQKDGSNTTRLYRPGSCPCDHQTSF